MSRCAHALRPLLRVLCPLCWLDARGARVAVGQATTVGLLLCCHVRLMIGWQRSHHLYVGSLRAGAAGAGGKRENQEWPVDGFSLSPLLAVVRRACGPVAVWSGLRCLCCPCAVMRAFFSIFGPSERWDPLP